MQFNECLEKLAEAQKETFALNSTASPEDQLKPIFKNFFESFGEGLAVKIQVQSEVTLSEEGVRPDLAIYINGLICGYIELKAPGLGADAPKLKGKHNKKQWSKLKALPNLIYTDGREFTLYRFGEREELLLRMHADPLDEGATAYNGEFHKKLEILIRDFCQWEPIVPHKPTPLARYLAPLTKFLREEVSFALLTPESSVSLLAIEWRQFFFPNADDAQFADAYAQTVTYAMLLARLLGAESLNPHEAAQTLSAGNNLLGTALELLGQDDAKEDLRVGFELLQRSLEALDRKKFLKGDPDLWLYFYEDFLAAYDPKLRRDYGVYYTPREIVELQVRLVSQLLEDKFDKKLGFADDGVVFLDPAVGTGTYPVAAVKHALKKVEERSGEGAVAGRASQMAKNMHGFEILVGPYSVAHLRITQALESMGATINDRLNIYLADTLESPHAKPPGGLTLTYKALTEEHEAARRIKNSGDVLVCLGNPPYDRQTIEQGDETTQRKGGWVRFGDQQVGGAEQSKQGDHPILEDFLEPARKAGQGIHLKNIYNDYVYFWRWALWRLFEKQKCGGIVSFITASSFLSGPAFVGMREVMRQDFDELWVIDLGGDNLGTRKTPNVFNIQTPVAIAFGIKTEADNATKPATVWYSKVSGQTREAKLNNVEALSDLASFDWHKCPDGWRSPFLPAGKGDFFDWPQLDQIFPWRHSGTQFKRSWPIAETEALLNERLDSLIAEEPEKRKILFKESSGKKITWSPRDGSRQSIYSLTTSSVRPTISEYSFRSFDNQHAILDDRFGDRLRPELRDVLGDNQIFFTTLFTSSLASGAGISVAPFLPDLHHFRGSFGGKDVTPLYRDASQENPNITSGLLKEISKCHGVERSAEDLAAYIYATLGGQSYTQTFWSELETPTPRVPITKDPDAFDRALGLGRKLIWLHTYGKRYKKYDFGNAISPGKAKCLKGISGNADSFPETFTYDPDSKQIIIGDGLIGPVAPAIWDFEVSGLKVVQSWLGYRMKKRAGKKSSPLDDLRPTFWPPKMTDDFLELIWVLEQTLDMELDLANSLEFIVSSDCYLSEELPNPTDAEQNAPKANKKLNTQEDMFS